MRDDLLRAWDGGEGDAKQANLRAKIISHQIRKDDEVARFHLPTILKVADGPLPVPQANMILYECYQAGTGVAVDFAKALQRLELAVGQGLKTAEGFLAFYLLDNTRMPVLPPDPDRALAILRRLARAEDMSTDLTVDVSEDMTAADMARSTFSSYVAKHFSIRDLCPKDLELITWHAEDLRSVRQTDYLPLALFFAEWESSGDYAGPQYRLPRDLLIKGSQASIPKVREACDAQLEAWGVKPAPEVAPTAAQKAVETVKVVGMLGGVSMVLVFWTAVGVFLTAVAATFNAFTVPILLGALVVAFVVSRLRK